jgi:hypothetical protein
VDKVDTSTPNVARMYDYYLGGKNNFAVDREAAEEVLALIPALRRSVVENRRFLRRAVRFLAGEAGIDQFLDIGTGLPTLGPVHEVAVDVRPNAKTVYVDYDPVVVSHGRALLTEKNTSVMIRGDLRKPDEILADPVLGKYLDLGRPIALTLLVVLQFLSDADDPAGVIATLRDAMAPGSYLVISHISGDVIPDKAAMMKASAIYDRASARAWPRGREAILRLFDGFELVEPGLVRGPQWRPHLNESPPSTPSTGLVGVGRKP